MKHPTPSDFIVNVQESHVNVIFKPSNSDYYFGRLADPEDIARFGPLSSPNVRHGNAGDTGDYPSEEVAQMAHSLAVKAITITHNRPLKTRLVTKLRGARERIRETPSAEDPTCDEAQGLLGSAFEKPREM